jgi:NADH dehydrogenase/NADH:ubiquinone oxidoreductase subunit G
MNHQPTPFLLSLTIDGHKVQVRPGTTILQAAQKIGVDIPALCYHPNLTVNAVCRLCTVEVAGARALQPACAALVAPDMVVNTESERVQRARRVLLELLASTVDLRKAPEIQAYIERYGADVERFAGGERRDFEIYDDNPFFIRDYDQCIMCWRCIQVCAEDTQFTFALTWGGRGIDSHVATAFGEPMPDTTCVFCGNCVGVCPTGALKAKLESELQQTES